MLRLLVEGALDLLWPCTCLCCGEPTPRPGFCPPCTSLISPRDGPRCTRCDAALPTAGPAHECGRCLARKPRFSRGFGIFDYAGPIGDAIRAGKYQRRPDGLPAVARALRAALPAELRADPPGAVLPVPLHLRRVLARRVDPPLELAAAVAAELGVPLAARVLVRTRDTPAQAGLSEVARRENVRGAFAVRRPPPADVLLVDDVATTGATLDAVARVVARAGAERVRVLSAAAVNRT
ncbi:MAG: ComF family protein [Myxococcales bacterium]|nr:ComF family protein [Myxococcales bacterium]